MIDVRGNINVIITKRDMHTHLNIVNHKCIRVIKISLNYYFTASDLVNKIKFHSLLDNAF